VPLPTIADVFQVVWNWEHPTAGFAKNVMHFRNAGANSAGDLASKIEANIASGQFNSVAEDAQVDVLTIRELDGSSAAFDFTVDIGGGAAGDDPVPATCCLVSLKTALAGKSFRGRTYLPFTAEVSQADGMVTSDVAGMNVAWDTWRLAMTADEWPLVVASYTLESSEDVVALLVETPLATQRRRQSRLR